VIEGYGLEKDKDMSRERLSAAESGNALKDKKIDAFMFVAGMPTAAITDVAATPGIKMLLIDHDQALTKMVEKWGPAYAPAMIPLGLVGLPLAYPHAIAFVLAVIGVLMQWMWSEPAPPRMS